MKSMNSWQDLHDRLLETQLLILGEMHGASVNPNIISEFVKRVGIKAVLIEVNTSYAPLFARLSAETIHEVEQKIRKHDAWLFDAGVLSKAHLRTYAKLISVGIPVIPIKIEARDWNRAERSTEYEVAKQMKKISGPALLVVGRLHARGRQFHATEGGVLKLYHPLGWLLKKRSVTAQIRYGEGEIFNFRTLALRDPVALTALRGGAPILRSSRSPYFDFDYMVRSTD